MITIFNLSNLPSLISPLSLFQTIARVYILAKNPYLCPPPILRSLFMPHFRDVFSRHFCVAFSINHIINQFCYYFGTNHDYYIKKGNFKLFSFKKWWFLRYLYIYTYKKCALHAQNADAGGLISAPIFRRGLFMPPPGGGLSAKIFTLADSSKTH